MVIDTTAVSNDTVENKVKQKGLSGSTLKIIAIITMLIDHTAAVVLNQMLKQSHASSSIGTAYGIMRSIGRVAFPIFCFLLVEGFIHTRNQKKYALRLTLFALVSEIPFDLALSGEAFNWGHQNVFWTLLISLIVMMAFTYIDKNVSMTIPLTKLLKGCVLAIGMVGAALLRTDYSFIGVACILILYITRSNKKLQTFAGCISFLWELPALIGFIPIYFYNGTRGINLKYFFYIFYPVHLLILYFIADAIKLM